MSDPYAFTSTSAWALNIVSSVGIILANKEIMSAFNFRFRKSSRLHSFSYRKQGLSRCLEENRDRGRAFQLQPSMSMSCPFFFCCTSQPVAHLDFSVRNWMKVPVACIHHHCEVIEVKLLYGSMYTKYTNHIYIRSNTHVSP